MPEVLADAPLAPRTTLRLGGPARRLAEAATEAELVALVREADGAGEPLLILAGGSNVVIADAGFPGTVVQVATRGVVREAAPGGGVRLTVAAGEPWDGVVAGAVASGLAGIECLSGIPGSTGATPIQNVGAYGQEVAETIVAVRALDRRSGAVVDLAPADCAFAYRSSAFKHATSHVVLAVTFELQAAERSAPLRYGELARTLGVEPGAGAPLDDVRAAVLALRRGKGMVLDPADHDTWSAGSFFTNPVLAAEAFAALEARATARRRRVRTAPVPRAGRPHQDVRGVAHRGGGIHPRPGARARRAVVPPRARADEPRRRHDRAARRLRARDRRRRRGAPGRRPRAGAGPRRRSVALIGRVTKRS